MVLKKNRYFCRDDCFSFQNDVRNAPYNKSGVSLLLVQGIVIDDPAPTKFSAAEYSSNTVSGGGLV